MYRKLCVLGYLVAVLAGHIRGRNSLGLPASIQFAAVEVALRIIIGRSDVVDKTTYWVDAVYLHNIKIPIGYKLHFGPITGYFIKMHPAIFFAGPGK